MGIKQGILVATSAQDFLDQICWLHHPEALWAYEVEGLACAHVAGGSHSERPMLNEITLFNITVLRIQS